MTPNIIIFLFLVSVRGLFLKSDSPRPRIKLIYENNSNFFETWKILSNKSDIIEATTLVASNPDASISFIELYCSSNRPVQWEVSGYLRVVGDQITTDMTPITKPLKTEFKYKIRLQLNITRPCGAEISCVQAHAVRSPGKATIRIFVPGEYTFLGNNEPTYLPEPLNLWKSVFIEYHPYHGKECNRDWSYLEQIPCYSTNPAKTPFLYRATYYVIDVLMRNSSFSPLTGFQVITAKSRGDFDYITSYVCQAPNEIFTNFSYYSSINLSSLEMGRDLTTLQLYNACGGGKTDTLYFYTNNVIKVTCHSVSEKWLFHLDPVVEHRLNSRIHFSSLGIPTVMVACLQKLTNDAEEFTYKVHGILDIAFSKLAGDKWRELSELVSQKNSVLFWGDSPKPLTSLDYLGSGRLPTSVKAVKQVLGEELKLIQIGISDLELFNLSRHSFACITDNSYFGDTSFSLEYQNGSKLQFNDECTGGSCRKSRNHSDPKPFCIVNQKELRIKTLSCNLPNDVKNVICSAPWNLFNDTWAFITASLKVIQDPAQVTTAPVPETKDSDYDGIENDEDTNILKQTNHTAHATISAQTSGVSVGIAIFLTIFLIIPPFVVTLVVFRRRYKNQKKINRNLTDKEMSTFYDGDEGSTGALTALPYLQSYETDIDDTDFDYNHVFGCGEFAYVVKGRVKSLCREVAVKISKPTTDVERFKSMLSELKIMIHVGNHPNIVAVVGACTALIRQRHLYIYLELCELGCLKKYLKNNYGAFLHQSSLSTVNLEMATQEHCVFDENTSPMSTLDLLKWSMEIASGMEYLSSKSVIHADLATRNVLLNGDKIAKISDFGLSKQLYESLEYISQNLSSKKIPWRFMPLEVLRDFTFTTKSDVYSYGMTLWEIFSIGCSPYSTESCTAGFKDRLKHGMTPDQPTFANSDVFKIMTMCWTVAPEHRPSFRDLKLWTEKLYSQLLFREIGQDSETVVENEMGLVSGFAEIFQTFSSSEFTCMDDEDAHELQYTSLHDDKDPLVGEDGFVV